MTQLTANEIKAMKMCINWNSDRECQRGDNHSDATPHTIAKEFGWNMQQVGGLLSSLEQKRMVWVDDRSGEADPVVRNNPKFHVVYLTDEFGIDAIFDIIEAEQSAAEERNVLKGEVA